jgi:two-component system sensor histidine kinase PilS (NtrC family)
VEWNCVAKVFPLEKVILQAWAHAGAGQRLLASEESDDLSRRLLWLIASRTVILLLGLNLAGPLGILPHQLGPLPFVAFFNVFSIVLAGGYLVLWWSGRRLGMQLYLQIAVDLVIATVVVAQTHGIQSPFVSFYLLIIIYCGLTLGRNGGMIGASLSTILYAGVIVLGHLGLLTAGGAPVELNYLTFRISLHALGFFAVALLGADLSQRLHAVQEELEQKIDSLEQLQRLTGHIVSSIRSGLFTTDLNGNITLFNGTAEELTEKSRTAAINHSILEVIGAGLWTHIHGADLFRDARPLRYEEWLVLPRGCRRFLGYSVSPLLDQERELIGYIVSFQDLTDIKRLEEEVRLKDRMAAIGRMASGIAHEIRNPLAAMRGSVEVLRSHLVFPGPDERLLDILIRESDRLNKFVEDFLIFAKPPQCERKPLDLVPLLHDSVLLLKNSPEVRDKHRVELKMTEQQIPILGDADKLRQVFWNLAQNALRAMPSGGTLTVAAKAAEKGGGEILFRDTGTGMTEEQKANLFQPFHSSFAGGTGLGLSIIFQIVEDHRGKIHFDSEPGNGTQVTLYLPPAVQ